MGKFGKKKEVNLNPLNYNIAILGESGIGKTTLAKEVCEKMVGEDGYIHFDMGKEAGADAIQGIVSETIENWSKLCEVVDDIVENKTTDYPDLQTVIWDTLDELIIMAEKEAIRQYNRKNPDKKADTINGAWGGFGKGQDKATEFILDKIWELKKVGVNSIIVAHVKRTDITDPMTQETYSKLTADTQQRYFNAIKNKMHFVGLAYIDRDIVKEKTGQKNKVTKEEKIINKVVGESRVISFRDDTYSVDSKSRFSEIVDRIPFSSDDFIKAMQDAILAEHAKGTKTLAQTKKEQAKAQAEADKKAAEYSKNAKSKKIDVEKNEELIMTIKNKFSDATDSTKTKVRAVMEEYGIANFKDVEVPTMALETIVDILTEE
ncbi:MAG: AAA family ATPase [Lachnospiraceae bacterium]|nr:AAA family ATPase [Lachnospiraceae bacterium]